RTSPWPGAPNGSDAAAPGWKRQRPGDYSPGRQAVGGWRHFSIRPDSDRRWRERLVEIRWKMGRPDRRFHRELELGECGAGIPGNRRYPLGWDSLGFGGAAPLERGGFQTVGNRQHELEQGRVMER